jgi:ABC-type transport system involved in cytochrome bd biosynthesis fused ATPase/permease subunit
LGLSFALVAAAARGFLAVFAAVAVAVAAFFLVAVFGGVFSAAFALTALFTVAVGLVALVVVAYARRAPRADVYARERARTAGRRAALRLTRASWRKEASWRSCADVLDAAKRQSAPRASIATVAITSEWRRWGQLMRGAALSN